LTAQGLANPQPGDPGAQDLLAHALAEAEQVVLLAPKLGAAHTILGNALLMTGNFVRAEAEHTRARALAPDDPWVNTMYGLFEGLMGRGAAAISAAQRATELDPLSAEAYSRQSEIFEMVRRPADALAALQRARQLGSADSDGTYITFLAELEEGDAAAAVRDCSVGEGDPFCLALAYHALGRQADADTQLTKLRALAGDNGAESYARIYAQWGRTDAALQWLETAYAQHAPGLVEMRSTWLFDPIRDMPRFKDIERRMNFPQ
jgi:tetratricopeptide (TPR) repeat protein